MPENIQNHPSVVIGGPGTFFLLIFRPYILGDLLKIKKKRCAQNHSFVVIVGPEAIFFLISRPQILEGLLKIKKKQIHAKSPLCGDWGSGRDFCLFLDLIY